MYLQGENEINYMVISDFRNTKKMIANVDKELAVIFLTPKKQLF